jgi:hypothetical protein
MRGGKLGRFAVAGLLACLAFAYFSAFMTYGINLPDEGTLLYKYERFGQGERLYADFHAGYTPGVYYVHGLLQSWFEQSIIPGRITLALINSLAVALLYLLAAPVCGTAFASVGALLYPAFMSVHPGHFASFNVPYPTWYSVPVFLGGLLAARNFLACPRTSLALLCGALAGLGFLFKPNIGAFQLACAMLIVLAGTPRRWDDGALAAIWWWVVWISVLGGVLAVFDGAPSGIELRTLVAPVIAVAILCAVRAGSTNEPASLTRVSTTTLAVVGGFLFISLPWLVHYARTIPLDRLLEDVLFVGSDYAEFFAKPHPLVLQRAILLACLFLALHRTPSWLRAMGFRPLTFALVGGAAAGVLAAAVLVRRPMVLGFGASVMSAVESVWAYAVTLSVLWLLTAFAARTLVRNEGFFVLAVGAALLYPAIYPRTDFSHWVWAAPVVMIGVPVLLSFLVRSWSDGESSRTRVILTGACLAPLVLLGALRALAALEAVYRLENKTIVRRPSVELDNRRAPVWTNIGRAGSYREIEHVVEALDRISEPSEPVLTFPALDFLSFFSGRCSPLRNSYFFPGFVGHDDEAIAVWTMRAHPPRFAVVLHDDWDYFEEAPAYYFLLADFIEREYRPFLRIGRYALLAHRSVSMQAPTDLAVEAGVADPRVTEHVTEQLRRGDVTGLPPVLRELRYDAIEGYSPALVSLLHHADPDVRAEAVGALRFARDDRTASALFSGVVDGRIPASSGKLALRLAGAWGGQASVENMIAHVGDGNPDIADAGRNGLQHFANATLHSSFWFGREDKGEPSLYFGNRVRLAIRSWFRDTHADVRLKVFAIAVAEQVGAYDELVGTVTAGCTAEEIDSASRLTGPVGRTDADRPTERLSEDSLGTAGDPRPWREIACAPETLAARFRDATNAVSDRAELRSRVLLGLATTRLGPMTLPAALEGITLEYGDGEAAAQDSTITPSVVPFVYATRAGLRSVSTHFDADAAFAEALSTQRRGRRRAEILWLASTAGGVRMAALAADLLRDRDPAVRAAAVGILAQTGRTQRLRSAENDVNEQVRTLARLASTYEKNHFP